MYFFWSIRRALLSVHLTVLSECRALVRIARALSGVYRALLLCVEIFLVYTGLF